ncbi:expressed unknown protein [Seminavis robusta]|uniref:Uncharacterized protein n=1 Tax=Seminavis robusta TaxID=568900 RepID=A0A9N8EK33_9STRA|nr:expressed unknown protein [Seminavis robusta]|eukprot:Sro1384_g268140.1 n/a (210) ;mRNA; f:22579-23208
MAIIPHPPIVWEQVRVVDLFFLLALGSVTELIFRGSVLMLKLKPASLKQKENLFHKCGYDTDLLRKKGPSAFVETSKSERQLLALDRELQKIYQQRQAQRESADKLFKNLRNVLGAIVFILYLGVPIVSFSSVDSTSLIEKESILAPLLFPISVMGMGFRISKWGLALGNDANAVEVLGESLSALIPFWAASSFVAQVMDGVEYLMLVG